MMFGSALYILNLNHTTAEDELVPDLGQFWVFDAFMAVYELSLGEFMVDSYRETTHQQLLVYILFFASTFLI